LAFANILISPLTSMYPHYKGSRLARTISGVVAVAVAGAATAGSVAIGAVAVGTVAVGTVATGVVAAGTIVAKAIAALANIPSAPSTQRPHFTALRRAGGGSAPSILKPLMTLERGGIRSPSTLKTPSMALKADGEAVP